MKSSSTDGPVSNEQAAGASAQCQNVLTGVTDGAKHPSVLSRKRTRRKRLGKIFWGQLSLQ
jgi:hypothetical protein